jgi:hypothetical protein
MFLACYSELLLCVFYDHVCVLALAVERDFTRF